MEDMPKKAFSYAALRTRYAYIRLA